jgi:alkylated DNA repair dioxygenase AlkB
MHTDVPPGFLFHPGFLTMEEEQRLIDTIRTLAFGEVRMHGVTAKRRVAQFGWHYAFESYQLTPAAPLPEAFRPIRERAAALASVDPEAFAEALVTEYGPGAGIGWHRDAPRFGLVAGISLGAECRMRFQKGTGENRITTAAILPARSLYFLTGESRNSWQHMIPGVKATRWSITFRTIREKQNGPRKSGSRGETF